MTYKAELRKAIRKYKTLKRDYYLDVLIENAEMVLNGSDYIVDIIKKERLKK